MINPTVIRICNNWKIDPALVDAMIKAEGGEVAFIRAVKISVSTVDTLDRAVEIACRTICHRMMDFVQLDNVRVKSFVGYLGSKWAPIGAENDPTNLNKNWISNVIKLWGKV